jgi:hypothetical protein
MSLQPFLSNQKSQFHGHETFPLRQLWLTKAYRRAKENHFNPDIFTREDAIVRFGVGRNMVDSIRHWALACDVLREDGGKLAAGEFGSWLLEGRDPYLINPASIWLIHWLLSGREGRTTTWGWLFNYVNHSTFDRELLLKELSEFVYNRKFKASQLVLKRDLETCLKTYLPRASSESREEAAEPLLSELGLLRQNNLGRSLSFNRGPKPLLPAEVFVFALCEFWERRNQQQGADTKTLPFAEVVKGFGSPGRVFKLDENAVTERLILLDDLTNGAMRWSDTAGVKNITLQPREKLGSMKFQLLARAYKTEVR